MKKLNVKSLRKRNILEIISAISSKDGLSRSSIAEMTSVSVMTVSNIMDVLLRSKAVYELEQRTENVGRNPSLVYFSQSKRILVLDLSKQDFKCSFLNLYMEEMYTYVYKFDKLRTYLENFEAFLLIVHEKCRTDMNKDDLAGIGVSLPAVYDPETDCADCPRIPEFGNLKIKATVEKYFTCPISADEDVKLAAVAAAEAEHKARRNLLYVYVGNGVGGAVINDGTLWIGCDGYAGDIGQLESMDGRRFEELLLWPNMEKRLENLGVKISDDMSDLWKCESEEVRICIEEYAGYMGNALYNACCILSPDAVIIEGGCSSLGSGLLERIEEYVHSRLIPMARVRPDIILRYIESPVIGAGIRAREAWIKELI